MNSSSENKLRKLQEKNAQLKQHLDLPRIPVSESTLQWTHSILTPTEGAATSYSRLEPPASPPTSSPQLPKLLISPFP
ncbi:hypothetical protein L0F63_000505 [Massospora cicadina]|nr:hypothetical protein L0F63_000505 [Massospora cicadina]